MLPQEMVDQTIDHLYDNQDALRACSLTCRSWVPSAQYHLFYSIWLAMSLGGRFLHLLESSPHVAQYVKILHIEKSLEFPEDHEFVDDVLPILAPKLKNVVDLRLSRINFFEVKSSTRSAFLRNFSLVGSLELHCTFFASFQDFTEFLVSYPQLTKLDLQGSGWEKKLEALANDGPNLGSSLPLRTISWSFSTSLSHLFDWLVSGSPSLHLTTVAVPDLDLEDIPAVSRLFESLGPNLEHIEIGVLRLNDEDIFPVPISNTSLRTLCLSRLGPSCATILSQITSKSIKEISFRLRHTTARELKALGLERIDEILSRSLFHGVQHVVFWLYGHVARRIELKQEIKRRMKRLHNKGVLVFTACI